MKVIDRMEVSLETLNKNVLNLMKVVEEMKELLVEDDLEVRDEVIGEIEEAKKREKFHSQEDVEKMFC